MINAVAPTRVCDNGGWTDTWFAGHGRVFNIAVSPVVEVRVSVYPPGSAADPVVLDVENYGDLYSLAERGRHPLLEAAIDSALLPSDRPIVVHVSSAMPAGSSTGTSAAVAVAMIGALDALTPGRLTPLQVAAAAHRLEVETLGRQSGVQDQLCAAFGGINDIEITDYPRASVSPIAVTDAVCRELERRLTLLFLGRAHFSSSVHAQVIAELKSEGVNAPRLERLRQTAARSRDALLAGDFAAFGRTMIDNNRGQEALHPSLVNDDARLAIDLAQARGAIGWKVNGAGGDGGSLTLLSQGLPAKRALERGLEDVKPTFRVIPVRLSRVGLQVWESVPTLRA